jgi:L-ascorbate metabolism protein UlaG (beta-lactamase superfamily)
MLVDMTLRRRARQFSRLVRHSALIRRTGQVRKPVLAEDGETGLTFIGHSSFFVQTSGLNLLIDPVFARWLFVLKRLRQPGLRIRDLPPLDLVLVTHAHFDHLHRPSLRAIVRHTQRTGRPAPRIVIPRNVADLVSDLGFREIIELDWWGEYQQDGISVVHTPSRHWGARVIRDMHRGYGGYVLRTGAETVYHAGDTAYFSGFREIGERLHPQLALLPIGAYHPASFRNVHASPADAVRAFLELGARWMVPMHYGSFRLSHEPIDEPLKLLASEARNAGVQDRVLVLQEGVTQLFDRD